MKKLLGVSIAAMLAVSGANATPTQTATEITGTKASAPAQASTQIATTSYVQGAYADMAGEHNKIVADITVSGVTGEGNYITNGNSVADNLKQLNEGIKSLDSAASDAYQLKSQSTVAELEAGESYNIISDGTGVAANLIALDDAVGTIGTDGTHIKDSGEKNIAENVVILDGAVANNSGAIGAATSAAVTTAMTGTNYISAATNVIGATKTLDTQVKNINDKYVPLYGNWSTGSVTGSVQINSLSTTNPV